MNKQTYIGMLRQGNNGDQLLSILDAIVATVAEDNDHPTITTAEVTSEWVDL